jgi:hypothetical protein
VKKMERDSPNSRTDLNVRRPPTPTSIHCMLPDNPSFASPTARPIPHVESALLPPRPSSIHIGLAEADPGIEQIWVCTPVESGFAQFREKEGGGVDPGMRVEATATDEQDGMEWNAGIRGPRRRHFSLPTSRITYLKYLQDYHLPHAHPRRRCITTPPVYTTTPCLSSRRIGRWILKRALLQCGREHDFSRRSPGPYDGPLSKETTEDLMNDGDEDSSNNAEDVEDDDSGKRMPTTCINCM